VFLFRITITTITVTLFCGKRKGNRYARREFRSTFFSNLSLMGIDNGVKQRKARQPP
jgi:hypothetical protein